jgi:hypothetical protein
LPALPSLVSEGGNHTPAWRERSEGNAAVDVSTLLPMVSGGGNHTPAWHERSEGKGPDRHAVDPRSTLVRLHAFPRGGEVFRVEDLLDHGSRPRVSMLPSAAVAFLCQASPEVEALSRPWQSRLRLPLGEKPAQSQVSAGETRDERQEVPGRTGLAQGLDQEVEERPAPRTDGHPRAQAARLQKLLRRHRQLETQLDLRLACQAADLQMA